MPVGGGGGERSGQKNRETVTASLCFVFKGRGRIILLFRCKANYLLGSYLGATEHLLYYHFVQGPEHNKVCDSLF